MNNTNILSIIYNKIRPIKWLVTIIICLIISLGISNSIGWRWGGSGANQSWNASGPGYHK